jgi:hypothetical protein
VNKRNIRIALTAIAAMVGCYFLIDYLNREGIVMFGRHSSADSYDFSDIKNWALPVWNPTNAIPLLPNVAVNTAMLNASKRHPGIIAWEVEHLSLEHLTDNQAWYYEVVLIEQSNRSAIEIVYVLMDGSVWEPRKKTGDAR